MIYGLCALLSGTLQHKGLSVLPYCALLAPLPAAVIIARFGVTLPPAARLPRYLLLLGIPIVAGIVVDLLLFLLWPQRWLAPDIMFSMSPTGTYAYECYQ